jgi:hypothetical protein
MQAAYDGKHFDCAEECLASHQPRQASGLCSPDLRRHHVVVSTSQSRARLP